MRRTNNNDKHFMGTDGLPELAASLDRIYQKVEKEKSRRGYRARADSGD